MTTQGSIKVQGVLHYTHGASSLAGHVQSRGHGSLSVIKYRRHQLETSFSEGSHLIMHRYNHQMNCNRLFVRLLLWETI